MDENNLDSSDSYFSEVYKKIKRKNSEKSKKKPITAGVCSRFYLYILGIGLLKLLSSLILGQNLEKENEKGIFGFCPVLRGFNFIQSIFIYIGYIILGFIFYYFKKIKRKEKTEIDEFNKPQEIESAQPKYIYTKPGENIRKNIELKDILLFIGFALHIETKKVLYIEGFQFFNYWTFEIFFMQLLIRKYFKIYFYKHHKMAIISNTIFGTIILISASLLPSSISGEDQDTSSNSYVNIKEKLGSYFYFILLILSFGILSFIFCFTRIYSKVLMQIKYISPYKLVILFGFAGLVVSILASIIAYYIGYKDNMFDYFSSMLKVLDKGYKYQFYGEIFLVSPIYSFSNALEFIFEMLVIYYLNPFFVLLCNTSYYAVSEFISFMLNLSGEGLIILHFILTELAEFWNSFWLMVYLEIIELNCCGLSDNVKKNIIKKGEFEYQLSSLNTIKLAENDNDD